MSRRKAQHTRLGERSTIDVPKQCSSGRVIADVAAAVNVAVAYPMLQRNTPLPAGGAGRRCRVRREIARALGRHCNRTIAWQPVRPVDIARLELLLGEHAIVRGGYRYDDGAKSHSGSLGLGYIDKAFSADLGVRRILVGDAATAVVLSFTYHVESTGLTPTPSETW